jgi:hypothetical protein
VDAELRCAYQHQDFDRVPDLIPEAATELLFNWLPVNWLAGERTFDLVPAEGGSAAADDGAMAPAGLKRRPFPLDVDWPFKFLPWFCDTGPEIIAYLAYDPAFFIRETIERFGCLLEQVAQKFARQVCARVN